MTSHLRVTIDDIDLVLPEDVSLSIEDRNPYLNDGIDTYSYQFEVPVSLNRNLFLDVDDPQSAMRLNSIEGKPMRIYIDGVLFRSGKVAIIDDQLIGDTVSISMTSVKKQLSDLFSDMTLQDIEFPSEDSTSLQIGEKIGNVGVAMTSNSDYSVEAHWTGKLFYYSPINGFTLKEYGTKVYSPTSTLEPQALGFSTTKEYYENTDKEPLKDGDELRVKKDFINTSVPFGRTITQPDGTTRRALYHNARISYIHHVKGDNGEHGDEVKNDKDGYGPYFVLDADRPQSGVCIYMMYVLECLFRQAGIAYNDTVIGNIEDMRHLSFYTTKCKYRTEYKYHPFTEYELNQYDFTFAHDFDDNGVNKWLEDHNAKGRLESGSEASSKDGKETHFVEVFDVVHYGGNYDGDEWFKINAMEVSIGASSTLCAAKRSDMQRIYVQKGTKIDIKFVNDEDGSAYYRTFECTRLDAEYTTNDYKYNASVMRMYATSENLPEMQVTSFLDSLWASFGLRFYYDSERNVAEPFFIRDMLRDSTQPVEIFGDLISETPMSEKVTGVTMAYSAEKERKEQINDIRKGVTDYDTRYDYLVERSPIIRTDKTFASVSKEMLTVSDMACYVDLKTGNAYRVKINKDGLTEGDINALQPSLFEVAQFKGVTEYADSVKHLSDAALMDGDVTDYIKELKSDFEPLDQNDLNANKTTTDTLLTPFTDETMWNEDVQMSALRSIVDSDVASVRYIDQILETDERYDITATDDGNSPLQHIDWGNCISMMRGGGSNAHIVYFDQNYDGHGSEKWRMVTGNYMMDSDSVSHYGAGYDYNGDVDGDGGGERFSLKICAYHKDADGNVLINTAESTQRRGLKDTFMAEYFRFLLERKPMQIKMLCNISYLLDIPWKRRFRIGDNLGWIDTISTKVSAEKGIESVEIKLYVM